MQIRHFRRFRQNGPFFAGDKNTVYQNLIHGLCHPDKLIPKQFRFGNPYTKITENNSQTFRWGRPRDWVIILHSMITETDKIQKQFGSAIPQQELPKLIRKQ